MAVEYAKDKVKQLGLTNVEVLLSDENKIPLEDNTVDFTFMAFVFHELENPLEFLKELERVSKPFGYLCIIDWKKEDRDKGPPPEEVYSEWEMGLILEDAQIRVGRMVEIGRYCFGVYAMFPDRDLENKFHSPIKIPPWDMKEKKLLEYLLKVKGIDKDKLKRILETKPEDEDMVSFLIRMNLVSYEDLNTLAEFTLSQKPLDKKDLERQGIFFEDIYFHYHRDDGTVYVVPYYHMRVIEKRKNVVNLYTGGIDKISVKLENENIADAFLDLLLIHINRTFLQKNNT